MTNTVWSDVLGNVTAKEAIAMYQATRLRLERETLAAWIARKSRELWVGIGEHKEEDWEALARALVADWAYDTWLRLWTERSE